MSIDEESIMSKETWLYIYEGAPRGDEEERKSIYIGIGQSMGRVYEPRWCQWVVAMSWLNASVGVR